MVGTTILVHVPEFPRTPFGGLCHFERMHTFFIAYCDYLMDLLTALVLPDMKHKVYALNVTSFLLIVLVH